MILHGHSLRLAVGCVKCGVKRSDVENKIWAIDSKGRISEMSWQGRIYEPRQLSLPEARQGRISEATGEVDGPCTHASEASNERCISAVLAIR